MEKIREYLDSKKKKNHIDQYVALLNKNRSGLGRIFESLSGNKNTLSKENVELGLILLKKANNTETIPGSINQWQRPHITQDSERFKQLHKGDISNYWAGKRFQLLIFFFGERMAPLVKTAWNTIPTLMYQSGYARRSFRGSKLEAIYFVRQINFVIDLIYDLLYDITLEEYAIYSNTIHLNSLPFIFAAALDSNDTRMQQLCLDAVLGNHDIARPSRGIIKAMLLSEKEEQWIAVEKLLLSAQRQEGLRQTILECLDETSLGAMKHFIKLILDHKLTRFSSVVRAIDVWAGFGWESEKESTIKRFLELGYAFLAEPSLVKTKVGSKDNAEVYMALWAQGVLDVSQCGPMIEEVLKGNNEKISLALYFLHQVSLSTYSIKYGKLSIEHTDPVIICQAARLINYQNFYGSMSQQEKASLYTLLEKQQSLLPKKTKNSKPRVFSWLIFNYGRAFVLDLMINLLDLKKEADMDKILMYFDDLAIEQREKITRRILPEFASYYQNKPAKKIDLSSKRRDFAFRILKDRSEYIRRTALKALDDANLSDSETLDFEALLTRKSADFRKSVLKLIVKQGVEKVKSSAKRLLEAKTEGQRLAGLDLLLWLKQNSPESSHWIENKLLAFRERKAISSKEEMVLKGLIETKEKTIEYNRQNGFGLFDPARIATKVSLSTKDTGVLSAAQSKNKFGLSMPENLVNKKLESLGKLVEKHKDHEYATEYWNGQQETVLLGNRFTSIVYNTKGMTDEEAFCNYPLHEVWRSWFLDSGLTERDIFIIKLQLQGSHQLNEQPEFSHLHHKLRKFLFEAEIPKFGTYNWQNPIYTILSIIGQRYSYDNKIDFLADLTLQIFNSVDDADVSTFKVVDKGWLKDKMTWREQTMVERVWSKYRALDNLMTREQFQMFWNMVQWYFLTAPKQIKQYESYPPKLYDYAKAYEYELIDKNTLYWRVLHLDAIDQLTKKETDKKKNLKQEFPFLQKVIDDCRNRILDVELIRGDRSTSMTRLAQNINRLFGIKNFARILKALGKDTLNRGYIYRYGDTEYNKKEILSALLKRCFPTDECNQESFDRQVKEAKISDLRLCEAATYSPQWLPFVSNYLNWNEMESAVWWLHAHTNAHHDAQTEAEIARYSTVDLSDFRDGAVDINWFKESYHALGKSRWKKLYDSAKYISDGGGHKRALLYADVILGNTKITAVTKRVKDTRNQDYVRVYGLIPLSKTNAERDLLRRYQFLQKFKKESKQFGSQRQTSEATAFRIALENLARTAGYSDPIRLQWAMETKEAQEIIKNAGKIELDNISLQLEIDDSGKSSIVSLKEGKKLKSVPAKHRKNKEYLKLKEYNKSLREQFSRTKKSLETAMVNGDIFTAKELEILMTHPVVSPMLSKLVLLCDDKLGFLKDGKLVAIDGSISEIGSESRIAHCADLYTSKVWAAYQAYCFEHKMVQPFKQIFRELYVPTSDELKEKTISRRYAGHQVQPRKTLALLKSRQWTVDYEEGLQKVIHHQNLIARMYAMADWFSPADVEAPTIETIGFYDRKSGKSITFENVDQRVFSETMRDIDLVVSVAHVGDVDPEASHSTLEMRAVILKETAKLFKLKNVSLTQTHAKIKGELGNYSVHLGSGVCHKIASASLSIIPVHSQHRGRFFLPFLDDDPKTAEILSKVLLLAKDEEIKDPTILQQL
jgi:hypothetical protein